jgi:hypothetical protein
MRKVFELNAKDVLPDPNEVLENQGMTGRALPARLQSILDSALELFSQLAEPRGLLEEISAGEFDRIFQGNGLNASEGPVRRIYPRADGLALFATTLGNALIAKSSELFAQGGATAGFMLDAVNSSGAERLGKLMGQRFVELLPEELRLSKKLVTQFYSPGHCGWHISAQQKLFETLRPQEIGIALNASHIMQPVKSLSGVLISGEMEIHRFKPVFFFCKECKTHKCVQRLAALERDN